MKSLENIWLKINLNNGPKIFLNLIYLKPRFSPSDFQIYLNHLTDIVTSREPQSKFIIMGDFNLSSISWLSTGNSCLATNFEGNCAVDLLNTLSITDLSQRNSIPNKFNRILDLVISNCDLSITHPNITIVPEDVFHPALSITVRAINVKYMNPMKSVKYNFLKANYESINSKLNAIKWHDELNYEDIDHSIDKFYKILNDIIDKDVPKICPKNDQFPKWYSKELINIMETKEHYRKLYKKTGNVIFNSLFITKRREFKHEKKKCYYNYVNNIESLVYNNLKSFFAYTKSIKQTNKLPSSMHLHNEVSGNITSTCNLFAKHFSFHFIYRS